MPVFEAVRLALVQIRVQKLKSAFTLIGVTIGVMFLIAVVSIINGMGRYMEEDLVGRLIARNSFELRRTPNLEIGEVDHRVRRSWRSRPPITEDDLPPVRASLAADVRWAAVNEGLLPIASRFAKAKPSIVRAVEGDWFTIKGLVVVAGRPFTEQEYGSGAPVVVIGDEVKAHFFPNLDPVGRELRIGRVPYTVVGVAEKQGSSFGLSLDKFVVVPRRAPVRHDLSRLRGLSTVIVQAPTPEAMRGAMEGVRQVMRTRHHLRPYQPDDFELQTSDSALAFWNRIQGFLVWAGIALPTVGLFVGAIVIMNIMLVAVAERTHEIGIRKALGARRRDILRQFLAEATALSTVGALLGIALGVGLAKLISAVSPLPASVALWSVVVAVGVGAGVGVVSGVYPASRAARLDPIAALRQE